MPAAGDIITVPTVPGSRIDTVVITSDSPGITSETAVASISVPVVQGRTYRVRAAIQVGGATGDRAVVRLREDSVLGTELQASQCHITQGSSGGYPCHPEAEWTAPASQTKTFVLSLESVAGTPRLEAAANRPGYVYVDYIRG